MLKDIKGIGDKYLKKLSELSIFTEEDLVNYLPSKYINYEDSKVDNLSLQEGSIVLMDLKVIRLSKIFSKGGLTIQSVYAIYEETNTNVDITFYNQQYVSKILKPDTQIRVFGKIKYGRKNINMINPNFEIKKDVSRFKGIVPIYRTKGLISQGTFSNFIKETIDGNYVKSIISEDLEIKYGLKSFIEALKEVHFPSNNDIQKSFDRIVIENICKEICGLKISRLNQNSSKNYEYKLDIKIEEFNKYLPFKLNISQKENVFKIKEYMYSKKAMNAILCGDVGSGKTVVALFSAFVAIKNGFQVALMAPTEVLAKQHYDFIKQHFDFNVCFLSSSTKVSERKKIYVGIKIGFYDFVVGTHSLINKNLEFCNLSLVILDEQHKFGVEQRSNLIFKGSNVDLLTLSATPIPRTMQLIAYKQSQILKINPRVEKDIRTRLVPSNKKMEMFKYIAKEAVENNKLCYVIAPLIYDDEGVEINSVESLYNDLKKVIDEKYIGVLHGKLKYEIKDKVINDFRQGIVKILISTTVVEVGIDIKDAVNMVIIDADRFGLASLHQLRGRICRNGQSGYCFLYTNQIENDRLKYFCENNDGFKIAEKDFNIRGAGEIFDTIQSGNIKNNISYDTINIAGSIAEDINLNEVKTLLNSYIEKYNKKNITLN